MSKEFTPTPDSVKAAVGDIKVNGDTLDPYRFRFGRRAGLWTTALTGGLFAGSGILSEGVWTHVAYSVTIFGSQVLAKVAQGRREKRQFREREASQNWIRTELDDPVDIFSLKPQGSPQSTTMLRWYRYDKMCEQGSMTDDEKDQKLEKIITLAEQNGISHIGIASPILSRVPGAKWRTPSGQLRYGRIIDTRKAIWREKKIAFSDELTANKILFSTPAEARLLLAELQAQNPNSALPQLMRRLAKVDASHPLLIKHALWEKSGQHVEGRRAMVQMLGMRLAERFNDAWNDSPQAFEGLDIDPRILRMYKLRPRMHANAKITPDGVQQFQSHELFGHQALSVEGKKIEHVLGMSPEAFIKQVLLKDEKTLTQKDIWDIEFGLFYLLAKQPDLTAEDNGAHSDGKKKAPSSALTKETPLARMAKADLSFNAAFGLGSSYKINFGVNRLSRWNLIRRGISTLAVMAIGVGGGVLGAGKLRYNYQDVRAACTEVLAPNQSAKELDSCVAQSGLLMHGAHKLYRFNTWVNEGIPWESKSKVNTAAALEEARLDLQLNPYAAGQVGGMNVGDVNLSPEKSQRTIWRLTPTGGAHTSGFWPEEVQNYLTMYPTERGLYNPEASIPPYKDVQMSTFGPVPEIIRRGASDQRRGQSRIVPLVAPDELKNGPIIRVDGQTKMAHGIERTWVDSESLSLAPTRSFQIPVIHGGDVVAAQAAIYEYGDDTLVEELPVEVTQSSYGTFDLHVPDKKLNGRLELKYWVDPTADTEKPLRAWEPVEVVGGVHEKGYPARKTFPMPSIIAPEDAAHIKALLGLPPQATSSEVTEAMRRTHTYSFTPHAGAARPLQGRDRPAREILMNHGEYAAQADSLVCNTTVILGLIATRGIDDGVPINPVRGYASDGNGGLTIGEGHVLLLRGKDELQDGTPNTLAWRAPRPQGSGFVTPEVKIAAGLALFGAGYQLAQRNLPLIAVQRRVRRRQQGEGYFEKRSEAQADVLERDVQTLKHMLYAPPSNTTIAAPVVSAEAIAEHPLRHIPSLSHREAKAIIFRRTSGGLSITPEGRRRLMNIVSNARKLTN